MNDYSRELKESIQNIERELRARHPFRYPGGEGGGLKYFSLPDGSIFETGVCYRESKIPLQQRIAMTLFLTTFGWTQKEHCKVPIPNDELYQSQGKINV